MWSIIIRQVDIFRSVPNYYHFMDADGTPKQALSGRLGTTHKMRRILGFIFIGLRNGMVSV